MIWLYRIFYPLAFLILLPSFLKRMRRRGGYEGSTAARLALRPPPPRSSRTRPRVWVQAVSVGELLAIESLLDSINRELGWEIVLSTTTSTAFTLAMKRFQNRCAWIGWFPLDFAPCSVRTWNRLSPDVVLLMEGELWPEHLHQARKRRVPVFLINARLSDRTHRRYKKIPRSLMHSLVTGKITQVLAASEEDAERWRKFLPTEQVVVTGNLKMDVPIPEEETLAKRRQTLLREFGFLPPDDAQHPTAEPLILFGNSTWPGEEEVLLKTLKAALHAGVDCRVLLVPRHAERRAELQRLLESSGFPYHLRSQGEQAPRGTMVYLADTTGELPQLLPCADLVLIGRSLPPNETGQNPLEAIAQRKPVVMGPNMETFRAMASQLLEEDAAVLVQNTKEAPAQLLALLQDPRKRTQLHQRAMQWLERQRGSREATVQILREASITPPTLDRD